MIMQWIKDETFLQEITVQLTHMREMRPVVDCITNRVTINDCANILLAAGGSPIMAEDEREIEEIVDICQGVALNMGILGQNLISCMLKAGASAKKQGIPVVFDPVGLGASRLRKDTADLIISRVHPEVIRGNMSEIRALAGARIQSRGVDAGAGDAVTEENAEELGCMIRDLARQHQCVVCATGAVDILSDGERVVWIRNGSPMLCDVTGTGCMTTALMGATCAAGDSLTGTAAALVLMGVAGELAAEECRAAEAGIGTFRIKLLDKIYTMAPETLLQRGVVYSD